MRGAPFLFISSELSTNVTTRKERGDFECLHYLRTLAISMNIFLKAEKKILKNSNIRVSFIYILLIFYFYNFINTN